MQSGLNTSGKKACEFSEKMANFADFIIFCVLTNEAVSIYFSIPRQYKKRSRSAVG